MQQSWSFQFPSHWSWKHSPSRSATKVVRYMEAEQSRHVFARMATLFSKNIYLGFFDHPGSPTGGNTLRHGLQELNLIQASTNAYPAGPSLDQPGSTDGSDQLLYSVCYHVHEHASIRGHSVDLLHSSCPATFSYGVIHQCLALETNDCGK